MNYITWFITGLPAFIIAASLHEYAHAWTADKLGDPTAEKHGRKTLNPLSHIDPLGLLLIIFTKFGWSKPVPINEKNFKKPIRDTALSSLAGPTSNFLFALTLSILLRIIYSIWGTNLNNNFYLQLSFTTIITSFLLSFIVNSIIINISLGVFNLLPIPPLDGYRITRALLPRKLRYYWELLEHYAQWLLLLFILPITPLGTATSKLITSAIQFIFKLFTGIQL